MTFLRNLRVSSKVLLIVVVNVAISVAVGAWAVRGMGTMDRALQRVYEADVLAMEAASEAERAARRIAVEGLALALAAASGATADLKTYEANIQGYAADFQRAVESFLATSPSSTERQLVDRIMATWEPYVQAIGHFAALARSGAAPAALVQAFDQEVVPLRQTLMERIEELLAVNVAAARQRRDENQRLYATTRSGLITLIKLAEQSRQAATEIASLVSEIRQQVERAVLNTEAGSRAVAEGVQEVETSSQTFEAIAHAVEQMGHQIQQVSAAAQRMAEASDQVVKAVDEIAAITEENAAGAEEVASTTQEQSSAVQEIASSAGSLANMAQELMKAVEAFKI